MQNADSMKTSIANFAVQQYQLKGLIGLGSGTTVNAWITALGIDIKKHPQEYQGCTFIPSSLQSEVLAQKAGMNVLSLSQIKELSTFIDIYVDGLDQVDLHGKMIKGKGGALTREKVLCQYSLRKIFLCDHSKLSKTLTSFLPVEIIPLAYPFIKKQLQKELGAHSELRTLSSQPFATDNGNWILDVSLPQHSEGWEILSHRISTWAGVVETGFFDPRPFELVVSYSDQKIEIQKF